MHSSPVKRRLAAIMSIDVVSYSAMMGADEEGTLRILRAHRALIDSAIRRHGGRIANTAGDSVLAEFTSPVEAVRAGIAIQNEIDARNVGQPPERRMLFRVGVHLDDVIVQDNGDLLGEGVNIAARLQAAAEPGGVMVSGEVAGQARAKLPEYGFERLGRPVMKNIVRTVEAFRIVAGARARQVARADVSAAPGVPQAAAAPRRSRVAVVAAAIVAGVAGGALAAWGLLVVMGGQEPAGNRREAEVHRQQQEAETLRLKAIEEAARRRAADEEARRKAAAEAAQRREQETADLRRRRANMTRSLVWSDIDCARSHIAAAPGMSCAASAAYEGIDGSGRFQRWAAGNHGTAATTYVVLVDAAETGAVHLPLRRDDESEFLPEISNFTRNNAHDWSSLVEHAGGYYATFKAGDGRLCFAFVKPGPPRGEGLAWVMRGYHCAAGRQPLAAERIAAVIGGLRTR